MSEYALQVVRDDEHHDRWRWVIHEITNECPFTGVPHEAAECDFAEWGDALNAGTIALAKVEGQPYENEASDPVGDADCAAPASDLPA